MQWAACFWKHATTYRDRRLLTPKLTSHVPDWICELLSPATAARDRVHKRNLYARAGVPHYWLIDPEVRVLEALTLRDGVWFEAGSYDDDSIARIPPCEAIELEVGRLFLPRDADDVPSDES